MKDLRKSRNLISKTQELREKREHTVNSRLLDKVGRQDKLREEQAYIDRLNRKRRKKRKLSNMNKDKK